MSARPAWPDPAVPGGGQSYATLMRTLGDDNLRKLLIDQKAMLFAQQQQVVDAMARATAWFGMAVGERADRALRPGRRDQGRRTFRLSATSRR